MKHGKRRGPTQLYREIEVCELDRIRGGVVVTDPGPGPTGGPRQLVDDPETYTVVVTVGGSGPTGPK
ncbi:MAG TPA: hypothetical protein VIX73_33815 [Kofleriaceae bacterium]